MSAIERWRGVKPEPTPTELVWQQRELSALNNRIDGWNALERIEIGAIVAYGAMRGAAEVYKAAEGFGRRTPEGADVYLRIADRWADGVEAELANFFRGRLR